MPDRNTATVALLANPYEPSHHEQVASLLVAETPNPRAAALALIRSHPDNPGPRLVFAELCQREGNHGRAQFIRDSVLGERPGGPDVVEVDLPAPEVDGSYVFRTDPKSSWAAALRPGYGCILASELSAERERLAATFEAIPATFTGERNGALRFVRSADRVLVEAAERLVRATRRIFTNGLALHNEVGALITDPLARGGLLEGFTCAWEVWRDHAEKLLAVHPIRFVHLSSFPSLEDLLALLAKHPTVAASCFAGEMTAERLGALLRNVFAAEWPNIELHCPSLAEQLLVDARETGASGILRRAENPSLN